MERWLTTTEEEEKMQENEKVLTEEIRRRLAGKDEKELVMILRFIFSLEELKS